MRLKNYKVAADLARELFSEKAAKMVFVSPAHHAREGPKGALFCFALPAGGEEAV
ncbi:hypothetical protein Daudx_2169 [Candidatus Desulforudis audaxviator]|nr:hypothetical protein Daudx_2169 [Candidatus Desulforudis audaxviator]